MKVLIMIEIVLYLLFLICKDIYKKRLNVQTIKFIFSYMLLC